MLYLQILASKALRKSGNKRKLNGKKVVKSQALKAKLKYETENSPKEQISELEKEIFSIKINEYENKLNRKKRLCSYMEEEMSIYQNLYNEKQLLKSESMKLLNNAFEDFSTEIFLLDQELDAMQHNYNEISKKAICNFREKVEKLSLLESKLEQKLNQVEKGFEQIPKLSEKFENLHNESLMKEENFMNEYQSTITEFEEHLHRIAEELNCMVNNIIEDDDLKLDLLPLPYKSLFLSGLLSSSWLDSTLNCLSVLKNQNADVEKQCCELVLSSRKDNQNLKAIISQDVFEKTSQRKHKLKKEFDQIPFMPSTNKKLVFIEEKDFKAALEFEKLCSNQHSKIETIKYDVEQLEKAIKAVETSGETCFARSYLIQVICKAGYILKEQL